MSKDMENDAMTGRKSSSMNRRIFLFAGGGVAAVAALRLRHGATTVEAKTSEPKPIKIVEFSNTGKRLDEVTVQTVVKTDAQWKAQLSPIAYMITRQAGTERAYTGPYWNLHDKGVYRCVCCGTAAFNADTKFESGTGWPSFWQPIAKENIRETSDYSLMMQRTAVSCARCDAHLGHVFDDGPQPTGLRYCMNSVAMQFDKAV